MKKFSQFGILALVLLFSASLLFAGGGGASNSGKTTVRLGIYPEDTLAGEIQMHQEWIRAYNAKYPDVIIQPAQYRYAVGNFIPLAQAGRVPTIFETWFTEPQKLINGGYVKDITEEVRALGWDTKMNPSIRNLMSRDGRLYGIPRDGYSLGLMINVDLFRRAGLVDANGVPRYPRTMAELATTAQQIKQRTGQAGLVLLAKDNAGGWHFTNIAWNFGASFMRQEGNRWVATVNSPEVVEALQYVKDLKWVYDVLTADPTNEDWGTGFTRIGTGTAAMYIAANDAVNQPTQANGLPVRDLAMAPIPGGPRGHQFSLMGGTPYMFAANATSAEVTAALRYLEIMGRVPEINDTVIGGLMRDARQRRDNGVPVIPDFPAWIDPEYLQIKADAIAAYRNVDERYFADYLAFMQGPGLRAEEPQLAQDLYAELTKCLQAVITDRNANPQTLLNTAQANFQRLLDQQVNR
jgi:ABC-type glycerol-3-phosphate transport system substrate-binding protein